MTREYRYGTVVPTEIRRGRERDVRTEMIVLMAVALGRLQGIVAVCPKSKVASNSTKSPVSRIAGHRRTGMASRKTSTRVGWPSVASCVALVGFAGTAEAVVLDRNFSGPSPSFIDTDLPGTDVTARPELAGSVIANASQSFSFGGPNSDLISGLVESWVVR